MISFHSVCRDGLPKFVPETESTLNCSQIVTNDPTCEGFLMMQPPSSSPAVKVWNTFSCCESCGGMLQFDILISFSTVDGL